MKTHRCYFHYWTFLVATALLFFIVSCGDDDEASSLVNDISVKSITPESPAVLKHYETSSDDRAIIEYDYNITHKEGARIWVRPYTDGSPSPGYLYSSSSVFKGKGSRKVLISIEAGSGTVNVDQLKVVITNPDQSEYLQERFIDVDYTFEE